MTANNHKILLVEDDESLRQMYSLILKKEGFSVDTGDDGVQGLSKARQGGYDLILLDLMMPNLDGIGFLKGLKEEQVKQPNGPIVILSNAGYEQVADEVKSLGAVDFMMKADLLPDDLIKNVKGYIGK